jgi:Transposase DDE domain
LVEWPSDEKAPTKFWLSTLGANVTFVHLVHTAKLRWRIERDYLELKQEIGLGHFEGRGWRGFHHHATLCIAAYAFLVAERAAFPPQTLRHYRRNACRSRRLPATGRCQSVPSATCEIRLQLCDVRSRCASPPYSTDAHAAANLDYSAVRNIGYIRSSEERSNEDRILLNLEEVGFDAILQ